MRNYDVDTVLKKKSLPKRIEDWIEPWNMSLEVSLLGHIMEDLV